MRRTVTLVIVAGCVIGLVTFGVRSSLGLFTDPLTSLRGWDREAFAFAIAIQNLVWGLGQPVAGGIATAAGSMGQFLFAPLGQAFISGYGPVTALVLLSSFVVLVPILAGALTG